MKRVPAESRTPWGSPVVFGAALSLRAIFILEWMGTPYFASPLIDAKVHEEWALSILGGNLVRERAFYQSPFYPYLLALVYKLCGHHPAAILWIQALVGSVSCVLLGRIAARCFGERAGLASGLLSALYRPFIFSNALLLKETWVIAGLALACLAAFRTGETRRGRDALLCGLALGWTAVSRGNVLLFAPALLAWWLWRSREGWARLAPAFVLGAALPILPATVHNFAASRDFVPIDYSDGLAFYLGNNPEAAGVMNYPAGITSDPVEEEAQITRIAESESGRRLKPSEVSRFWFRRGRRFILEHPGPWLALTWKKLRLFWNWFEPPDDYCLLFVQRHFSILLKLPLVSYGFAATFGILGVFLLASGGPNAGLLAFLAGVYLVSILPFPIADRYRLPMAVFFIPFSGAALLLLYSAAAARDWRRVWKPCLAAAPIVALCWAPPLYDRDYKAMESVGWSQLVAIYCDMGRYDAALDALDRAFAASPSFVTEPAIDRGAVAYEATGQGAKALLLYKTGLEMYPGSARLHHNQGALMYRQSFRDKDEKLLEEGISSMKEAIRLRPDYGLAYRNLSNIYGSLGKKDLALEYGRRADLLQQPHGEGR